MCLLRHVSATATFNAQLHTNSPCFSLLVIIPLGASYEHRYWTQASPRNSFKGWSAYSPTCARRGTPCAAAWLRPAASPTDISRTWGDATEQALFLQGKCCVCTNVWRCWLLGKGRCALHLLPSSLPLLSSTHAPISPGLDPLLGRFSWSESQISDPCIRDTSDVHRQRAAVRRLYSSFLLSAVCLVSVACGHPVLPSPQALVADVGGDADVDVGVHPVMAVFGVLRLPLTTLQQATQTHRTRTLPSC